MPEEYTPRRIPACQRCRNRKTKCDSLLPSCTNCSKAGVTCMNHDKVLGKLMSRNEIWSMEQGFQASSTNSALSLSESQSMDTASEQPPQKLQKRSSSFESLAPDHEASYFNGFHSLIAAATTEDSSSHVSEDVKGELRRYSQSLVPQGAREQFIAKENMSIAKLGRDFIKAAQTTTVQDRATDITAYEPPILRRVAKRYFSWMNSAFPVMHETQVYDMIETCHDNTNVSCIQLFQSKMVIAVSLASIGRPYISTSKIGHISQEFWKSATKLLSVSIERATGLTRLQISLLLLQYNLLVPKAGNLWQLAGSAMRYATELGLYAEPNPGTNVDPLTLDLRRRMFWTCYCVDRILSTSLGRPSSISDSWITAKMPSLVEDKLITASGFQPGPTCHLKLAVIHQVHICRLQSEIHNRLYAPSAKCYEMSLLEWTWHTYDQLTAWRQSFLYPTPLITKEWTELQFHIGVVLLMRPSPNRPNPSLEELHVAFHSAGQVSQLIKIMHREESAVLAWLNVQNLFMCGLTYIQYLKVLASANSSSLCMPFMDVVLQIQTCTSMLETLAALEVGDHEQIRNVYEVASTNVLRELSDYFPASRRLPEKHGSCIWYELAKPNCKLHRPIHIQGRVLEIQKESTIPLISKLQERDNSQLDDDHFFSHDVDAYPESGISHSPQDLSLHTIYSTNGLYSSTSTRFDRANSLRDSWLTENILGGYSATEPDSVEDSDLPDMTEVVNDGIERWFLYPI